MKLTTLAALALIPLAFLATASALEVDEEEIRSTGSEIVQFENYSGPHALIETVEAITSIGRGLGNGVASSLNTATSIDLNAKYSLIHAIDPNETGKFDADIIFINEDATVDHIRNLRRIIAGYLMNAYGYSASDASTLATFATVYNAVYRNKLDIFKAKYKDVVTRNLTEEKCGLSTKWSEWPGASQIVIPLFDVNSRLSSVNTTAISDRRVIDSIREQDDLGIDERKNLADLMEREADEYAERAQEAEDRAEAQRIALQEQQKREQEARTRAEQAQQQAEQAQKALEQAQQDAAKAQEESRQAQERLTQTQTTVTQTQTTVTQTQRAADQATQQAQQAQQQAQRDREQAEQAQQQAQRAQEQAQQNPNDAAAQRQAEQAQQQAQQAQQRAEQSAQQAQQAQQTQTQAQEQARQAQEQAQRAQEQAQKAQEQARQAQERVTQTQTTVTQTQTTVTQTQTTATQTQNQLSQEQQKTQQQRNVVQEAENEASKNQNIADQMMAEAQRTRTEIAKDQQRLLMDSMAGSLIQNAVIGLRITDEKNGLSGPVRVDASTGRVLKESPVTVIRGRTILPVTQEGNATTQGVQTSQTINTSTTTAVVGAEGVTASTTTSSTTTTSLSDIMFIAICGENTGKNSAVKLCLLDAKDMEIQAESKEIVAEDSVLVQDGNYYYCVIQNGSEWVIAKYDGKLNMILKSTTAVRPDTPITITNVGIVAVAADYQTVLLNLKDLKPVGSK